MLLLIIGLSISSAAIKLEHSDKTKQPDNSNEPLGDDFSIKIRSVGYGILVKIKSLTGKTDDARYYIKYDFKVDRKDREDENFERVSPEHDGKYSYWYFRFERAKVYVEVKIGTQTVTKTGFAIFGFVFLI